MPCWERNEFPVEVNTGNWEVIKQAVYGLVGAKYVMEYTLKGEDVIEFYVEGTFVGIQKQSGMIRVTDTDPKKIKDTANMIKREISKTIIETEAKKKKWILSALKKNEFIARRF